MAIRYTISAAIFIQKPASTKRPVSKLLVKANNHIAATSTTLQNGSSLRIKVFEDNEKGIVCYKDANGEIICEGYDEGPRFHQEEQISRITCDSRDSEMVDLLDRWLQIVDGSEFSHGVNGANGHTDINCKPSTHLRVE